MASYRVTKKLRQLSNQQVKTMLVLALVVVCLFKTNKAQALEIQLRKTAVSHGTLVRIGDIATIITQGGSEGGAEVRRIENIGLITSPTEGTKTYLSPGQIQSLLRSRRMNVEQWTFTGARRVEITAARRAGSNTNNTSKNFASQNSSSPQMGFRANTTRLKNQSLPLKLSPKETAGIEQEVKNLLQRYLNYKSKKKQTLDIQLKLTPRQIQSLASADPLITVRGGTPPWVGRQKIELEFKRLAKNQSEGARQHEKNKTAERFKLEVVVKTIRPFVVARRAIRRGHTITAADVELIYRSEKTGSKELLYRLEDAIGRLAKRSLRASTIIDQRSIKKPILIKRGDIIQVVAKVSGFTLRTDVKALRDGAKDDLIPVENVSSKETFEARVISRGEVSVFVPYSEPTPKPARQKDRFARRNQYK